RPAVAEPGEGTGVELHEGAHLGCRDAPGTDRPAPAAALGGQAEGAAEPADRAAAEADAFHPAPLLGGGAVVEVGVRGLQQRGGASLNYGRYAPGRGAPAEAVQQPARAVGFEPDLQALKLPDTELQGLGSLRITDLPSQRGLEQPGPRHFLAAHRECLPCLHGVTFLLN